MHTIALLSYEDFITEITGVAPVVRVQDYYQVRYEDGAEWHEFFVELSARREYPPQDEVYICRFGVGGGFWHTPQRDRAAENARCAVEALRQDLEHWGFGVRPGLSVTEASVPLVSGPWHFEEDENRLLALIPDLPLPAVRRWKRENLEIRVWDKDDEIDECIELAACELVLQVYLGENDIDHALAGLALYLLGKAGVTIDENDLWTPNCRKV